MSDSFYDSKWTAADLVAHFGPIPLWRVWSTPLPGQATEQDVIAINERKERLCELVDGTLVEKSMGREESRLTIWIGYLLMQFVLPRQLGEILGADGPVRLFPGLIRVPDISFISAEKWNRRTAGDFAMDIPPDLAVEVISPSNTKAEMDRKLQEYFQAGVRLVWYVYPAEREVYVYESPEKLRIITMGSELDGGSILPGFRVELARLFAPLSNDSQPQPSTP